VNVATAVATSVALALDAAAAAGPSSRSSRSGSEGIRRGTMARGGRAMPVTIDPAHDALVIVDVQNDFCPGGALAVNAGDEVVPVLNRYAERFARAGAAVFASRDWHPAKTRHFKEWGGVWPPHCVQGTRGAEFHAGLSLPRGTEVVSKGMDPDADAYSAFQGETPAGKPLAEALAARGVRRLFVGGLATDYCVKATVLDARRHGFDAFVLADASRAVELQAGDAAGAMDEMKRAGARVIHSVDDVAGPS
jgi:nicotinamidase/pyrazinamidase